MFARTALSFALWLQVARGQSIPEKGECLTSSETAFRLDCILLLDMLQPCSSGFSKEDSCNGGAKQGRDGQGWGGDY